MNFLKILKSLLKQKHISIGKDVTLINPKRIKMEKGVFIGDRCFLGVMNPSNPDMAIEIGENTWIGLQTSIGCNVHKIIIGKNVTISAYSHINDYKHNFEDITKLISSQGISSKGDIIIEDDCWIGYGSHIIGGGITIGKHSVIGANAVVTKSIPPYSVAIGIPAKVIKKYNFETNSWETFR